MILRIVEGVVEIGVISQMERVCEHSGQGSIIFNKLRQPVPG